MDVALVAEHHCEAEEGQNADQAPEEGVECRFTLVRQLDWNAKEVPCADSLLQVVD